MQFNLNIDAFIRDHITRRHESLLNPDFKKYNEQLNSRITGKTVLVIGGAGTIGSSYIKAILKFNIAKLVVEDSIEKGLTELM